MHSSALSVLCEELTGHLERNVAVFLTCTVSVTQSLQLTVEPAHSRVGFYWDTTFF